jgi:hypothetical protein
VAGSSGPRRAARRATDASRFRSRSGGWGCPRAGCGLRRDGARVQAAARADANRRVRQPPHQSQHGQKRSLLYDYSITAVRVAATRRARRQPALCSRSSCPTPLEGLLVRATRAHAPDGRPTSSQMGRARMNVPCECGASNRRRSRASPSGSSSTVSIRATAAARGPLPQKRMSDSTRSGSPSKTASTAPSARLRTQPVTARASAARATANRNPTPCTRPCTMTLRRTVNLSPRRRQTTHRSASRSAPNRETKQQRMSWFGSTATRPTATPGHRKKAPRRAGARLSARVPGRSARGRRTLASLGEDSTGRASLGVRHLQGDGRWHGELHVLDEQRHLAASPRWCNRELPFRAPRQTSRFAIALAALLDEAQKSDRRRFQAASRHEDLTPAKRRFSLVYHLALRRVPANWSRCLLRT